MAGIISRIRKRITRFVEGKGKQIFELIYKRLPLYYKNWDRIPLYNWFEIQKGNFKALNKLGLQVTFDFFFDIYKSMVFQMENLDLELIRLKRDYYVMLAEAAITNDSFLKFEADLLKVEIDEKEPKDEEISLNKFIDYIELSLDKPGSIDPFKMSASRAYSLYHRAKDKNKRLQAEINKRKHGKHN